MPRRDPDLHPERAAAGRRLDHAPDHDRGQERLLIGRDGRPIDRPRGRGRPGLWAALALLAPMYYNPASRWQFEPDRMALLVAVTGLLAGRSLWRGDLPRGRFTALERAAAVFLLANLLAMVLSDMPHWGLWGDPAWRSGVLLLACGVGLLVLSRAHLSDPQRGRAFLRAVLLGSGIAAAVAILEAAGVSLLPHNLGSERVAGTFAHPNLLAAYLAMALPLTLAFAGRARRPWAWLLLLALQAGALVLTYSRSGWLAGAFGVAAFALLLGFQRGSRRLAAGATAVAGLGLAALLALSALPPLPGSAPHALQTLTSIFQPSGATAQIRLFGWQSAIDALRDSPLIGYGPAAFRDVVQRYAVPQLAPFGGPESLGGRAHNRLLEVAVEAGLLGLAAYAAFLYQLAQALWRRLHASDDPALYAGIAAALAANLVNNLFSFDSAATWMLFWSLAGMAEAPAPVGRAGAAAPRRRLGIAAAVACALTAGWMTVPDMMAHAGETACGEPRACAESPWLRRAVALSPTPEVFQTIRAGILANAASGAGGDWRGGDALLTDLTDRFPRRTESWLALGLFYRRWQSAAGGHEAAEGAVGAYVSALRLSPRNPDIWLDAALAHADRGDLSAARRAVQAAEALLPDYYRLYSVRGMVLLAAGEPVEAQVWLARADAAWEAWESGAWRR